MSFMGRLRSLVYPRFTASRLASRKWWFCLFVCGAAVGLDIAGRPIGYDYAGAISAITTALIGMQTWLDRDIPTRGHWTPNRTLGRKWLTGSVAVAGLFVAAGIGFVMHPSTLSLLGAVMGAWLGSQTYLDYRAGKAQEGK
ncbi:MAG: hypothetical protein JXA57_11090 [Armatimonadetes bacterium]|nr:hypothetical protein [Armatimonadota bacterium]